MTNSEQRHVQVNERTTFPAILSRITEVVDGFTVTVWLRHGPGLDQQTLLADEPADSIEQARLVATRHAKEHAIVVADEIITMHNLASKKEPRH